jgi:hypothetical protein
VPKELEVSPIIDINVLVKVLVLYIYLFIYFILFFKFFFKKKIPQKRITSFTLEIQKSKKQGLNKVQQV